MSAKLKNAGKAKAFFLMHGEKLGILLFAGLAGWIAYGSLGREPETRQAPELTQLASATQSQVEGFSIQDAIESGNQPPTAEDFRATPIEPVDPSQFAISRRGWDRSVVPPIVLRKDPVLLPPQELEGRGYTVLMAFYSDAREKERLLAEARERARLERDRERDRQRAAETEGRDGAGLTTLENPNRRSVPGGVRPGGAPITGFELIKEQSCAVVVAKVPVEDQLKIYQDTFENALGYDPTRDLPRYLGYYIERAEVRGEGEPEWRRIKFRNGLGGPKLPAVTDRTITMAVADWATEMEELVDDRYFHPSLTFPLPARVGRDWDSEVVHSDLPLAADAEAALEEEGLDPAAETEVGEETLFDPVDNAGGIDGVGRGRRGGGRRPGGRTSLRGGGRGLGGGATGFAGEYDYGGGGGGGRRPSAAGAAFAFEAPHVMVRFIDFDVAPGRRYQYRFQLLMLDVNGKGQTPITNLDKEVKKRVDATTISATPFVRSEWSEPSQVISIPLPGSVRVAETQASSTGAPTATLVVEAFDLDDQGKAIQASIEKDKITRGTVLNLAEKNVEILVDQNRFLEKVDLFNFRTGVTLIDVSGGEKLTRSMSAPGSVLIMDSTGRLIVRSQTRDYNDVEQHRQVYSEDETTGRGAGGGYDAGFDPGFDF